jgi:uncharacterized FlaG/YvyC family protein
MNTLPEFCLNHEKLLEQMFSHQMSVKLFHFQTKSYAAHKASDKYLDTFAENLDKLFEVAQGSLGQFDFKNNRNIELKTLKTTEDILEELDSFLKVLNCAYHDYKKRDLINILDDMVAEVNKFKYLLNFN